MTNEQVNSLTRLGLSQLGTNESGETCYVGRTDGGFTVSLGCIESGEAAGLWGADVYQNERALEDGKRYKSFGDHSSLKSLLQEMAENGLGISPR